MEHRSSSDESLEYRLSELHSELERQANPEATPGRDIRIAAFAEAVLGEWENAEFQTLLCAMAERRRDNIPASAAVHLIRNSLQVHLLYPPDNASPEMVRYKFPEEFDRPEPWAIALRHAVEVDWGAMYIDLTWRKNARNEAERYKSLKMMLGSLCLERERPLSVIDFGCGRNLGLRQLAANIPFQPVTAGYLDPVTAQFNPEESLTAEVNQNIDAPLRLGPSLGLDMAALNDGYAQRWAKAAMYPSELLDEDKVARYEHLENIHLTDPTSVAQVKFMEADILTPELFESFSNGNRVTEYERGDFRMFDVAFLSTILYQFTDAERAYALRLAEYYTKEDGVIVVQDFVTKDSSAPNSLAFHNHWFAHPFSYTTLIKDSAGGEFKEVFKWSTSRCSEVAFPLGITSVKQAVNVSRT